MTASRHPFPVPAPLFPEDPPSGPRIAGAKSLADWVGPKVEALSKKRTFKFSKATIDRARTEMDAMGERGDWKGARGAHLVALYAWLHRAVYGVDAVELDPRTWALASVAAQRLIDHTFERDAEKAVAFMRWTWGREESNEKWRRENGREGRRIGWRLQFAVMTLVTDYRVAMLRTTR